MCRKTWFKRGKGMNFGVVITVIEMFGIYIIEDFINKCVNRRWIVNEINIKNNIDIYNKGD